MDMQSSARAAALLAALLSAEPAAAQSNLFGTGANFGSGWQVDPSGGLWGTGTNFGSGWTSDGAGGLVGTGRNFGSGWMPDGAGGFVGTGANFGSGWQSDGRGGFVGTGANFGSGWQADGAGGLVGTGRNFGSGSSREAAVYALWDYGIRCVIAPSFGDIFASNAVKNGLLPARVSEEDAATLQAWLNSANDTQLQVDLESCTITAGGQTIPFSIDPVRRTQLLNGWDDIDLTRERAAAIASFRTARAQAEPWAMVPPSA